MAILSKGNETKLLIVGGLVAGFLAYKSYRVASDAVEGVKNVVTTDLNPVSEKNIVNKGVSKVVEGVTGGKHKDLGSFAYCLFNSDAAVCNPELLAAASRNNISFYAETKDGTKVINPQLTQLWEQEKEFYFEEEIL